MALQVSLYFIELRVPANGATGMKLTSAENETSSPSEEGNIGKAIVAITPEKRRDGDDDRRTRYSILQVKKFVEK